MWRVGIDVGGTFTDLFAWEERTGKQVSAKVLTTKQDRSIAVLESIEKAGIDISDISYLMHGTTTATNALIERSYPNAALITTEGFRDTIEIGRQHRQHLYDPYQTKPKPIINRRYRFTVPERTNVHGESERPLDVTAAREVAEKVKAAKIQSVAIGFINSYASGKHEEQMRDILRECCPDIHIVLSSETRPIFREHGRFVTTAVRAACMPVMVKYMDDLENRLSQNGFSGKLLILKSSGGVMSADAARQHPEDMLESGPAGGVAYAGYLTEKVGFERILHTDVGGTSFDVSIVEHGKGLITRDHELEWEVPIVVPMLDIHSVGSGGGSIGWVDAGGSLRVGPKSAGSEPGPVCYGRGGTQPTITDANLLLGRLDPTLNGKINLDVKASQMAMEKLAGEIGLPTLATAEGMIRIGCEYMAQAVKKVLVARGRDPRDFVYTSFGGAGALAACFVAKSMNIPKVIVPPHAGVASAFGATVMDLRQDVEHFYYAPVKDADLEKVNTILNELETKARKELIHQGFSNDAEIEIIRSAQMRYVGQSYEVDTPLPNGTLNADNLPDIEKAFHGVHMQEFGVSSDDFAPAFVSFSITAIGQMDNPPPVEMQCSEDDQSAIKGQRDVYFDGAWINCNVYKGESLTTHHRIEGPAIIEYDHACTVLPPHTHARVNTMGALVIDIQI
ncbi:MAG: hydantoinase/oxoprolinase family protein [Halomonas sp.]|uniref:hydantoinase/oxoprolinase family protein n=1 Tax=Halomonadaceae TaxID=28256 RepID=UPI0004B386B0|nr:MULTISPECIES: hydantoinase/oxoprolinase family protein [Halomonas]MAO49521.1 hydantoinase [Pusillimonas sp.]MCE7520714.1 hydantoinase/oxoprolinase family protein [Halomonas titanicae]NQY76049.1 hydantoinase/oxoprolinase family protein [Halomonas sp.]|tara:strand:+ start:1709 stop:3739 length:2031 start_codon:yes stop_codon:yes gene_type:complete